MTQIVPITLLTVVLDGPTLAAILEGTITDWLAPETSPVPDTRPPPPPPGTSPPQSIFCVGDMR